MRWIVITLLVLNVVFFGWEISRLGQGAPVAVDEASLPPLKGAKLVLLTERLPSSGSGSPPPAPALGGGNSSVHRAVDRVEARKESMCVSVGPYEKEAEGASLVKNLDLEGVDATLEALELSREVQYWVLIPPAATRKSALQTLRKLQAKRIDSYLVSSGEMENAISLGLFNRQASAKGVLAEVTEGGFAAQIYQKERVQSEYWVRIEPGQTIENLQETLGTLVVPGGHIKISSAACEMFAQTK